MVKIAHPMLYSRVQREMKSLVPIYYPQHSGQERISTRFPQLAKQGEAS